MRSEFRLNKLCRKTEGSNVGINQALQKSQEAQMQRLGKRFRGAEYKNAKKRIL